MRRRDFLARAASLLAVGALPAGCTSARGAAALPATPGTRRLRSVGVQLYSLRDDARRDLERTIADIAGAGYRTVELLGSMNNFGMAPARLRAVLDRNGLRATSTHVSGNALDDLERNLDEAAILGHRYLVVASLPIQGARTLDHYRQWADRLNEAGRRARTRDIYVGFHNHANDHTPVDGAVPYDLLVDRTDPALVRLQLDTGNAAMAGIDPMHYMRRNGSRYWLFHLKDVPRLGATSDTGLGEGIVDFRRLLGSIDRIEDKELFVEQETYPAAPLDSVRRDYTYITTLEF